VTVARSSLPVSMLIQGDLGLMAFAEIAAVNAMMREGDLISGVHFSFDPLRPRSCSPR
jgi:putative ABC transport system permease protein